MTVSQGIERLIKSAEIIDELTRSHCRLRDELKDMIVESYDLKPKEGPKQFHVKGWLIEVFFTNNGWQMWLLRHPEIEHPVGEIV